ncbi:hypothetical protein S40288_10006 [Stachybotrys chartarum IBT 40288]|nr:hypothetical protein S40288_10006 [Stachybotrys chartarum IBT 40288]
MSAEPYAYTPLPGSNFIRLLTNIYRRNEDNAICAKLVTVSLYPTPPYIALSYTWGSPYPRSPNESPADVAASSNTSHHITIDDQKLPVTQNLLDYLTLHASSGMAEDDTPDFWIDAICINQKDLTEKSIHVSRMHLIYKQAFAVVVWLGPADEYTADAIELINRIGDASAEILANSASHAPKMIIGKLGPSGRHWKALKLFFLRQWFQRAWVIQQIVLATEVYVMVGNSEVAWEAIVRSADFLSRHETGAAWHAKLLSTLSALSSDTPGLHLGYVLPYLQYFVCENPRDKVYSALGWTMVGKAKQRESFELSANVISADYDSSVVDIYVKTVKHVCEDQNLSLLTSYRHSRSKFINQLPSWVPDLSHRATYMDIDGLSWSHFKATLTDGSTVFTNPNVRLLETLGQKIDTISHVELTIPPNNTNPVTESVKMLHLVRALLVLASRIITAERGPGPVLLTLWMVLTNGGYGVDKAYQVTPEREAKEIVRQWIERAIATGLVEGNEQDTIARLCLGLINDLQLRAGLHNDVGFSGEEAIKDIASRMAAGETLKDTYEDRGITLLGLRQRFNEQALFCTALGRIGFGFPDISPNDTNWLIPGVSMPLILRETERGHFFSLGRCFIDGVMKGEAFSREHMARIIIE